MQGTLVCAMTDEEDRTVLQTVVELSERLGLRLVLAYARDGVDPPAEEAAEDGVADRAEQRSGAGDPAAVIGQIAAELIVVGARARGRLRRRLDSRLASQLGGETPVPVLIALPRPQRENGRR
jgi:nucleotide-binding universal stress UspA family protein